MSPASELRWRGTVASRGLAAGPVVVGRPAATVARAKGSPAQEWRALTAAIDRTRDRLQALAATADEMAAEILEIQLAIMDDEGLLNPAREAIDAGASAEQAWAPVLGDLIADYEAEEDEYFRARAVDLRDLRDRVVAALTDVGEAPAAAAEGDAAILLDDDLSPSRFLETDWSRYRGAALTGGSTTSHVAMLARSRGIPLLVGLDGDPSGLPNGVDAVLDAEGGWLVLMPEQETRARFAEMAAERARERKAEARHLAKPAVTARGRHITVLVNVDDPGILDMVDPTHCDGVGLTRTEFLFRGSVLPDEETQYRAYATLLRWADGRPVTIRTLDAGGDKPIPGLTRERETNSFLGVRGIRLSLARPEVFRIQVRALARAAALGPLKVMCPMVTVPAEMEQVRGLLHRVVAGLQAEGVACALPQLGMMVEVPAAAMRPQDFAVDFYSIGSNDLVQYVTATARDNAALAALHDPHDPAVLELIARVVSAGAAAGREVSVCGDMAAEPELLNMLLGAGLTAVSVAPAALARVKATIARFDG